MYRATDNRCSLVVDMAERKRLQKASEQRMKAMVSPMKITAPRKQPKNTKKLLQWRAMEQVSALFVVSFAG